MKTSSRVSLLAWLLQACSGLADIVAELPATPAAPGADERSDAQLNDAGTLPSDAASAPIDPPPGSEDGGALLDGGVCLGSLAAQTFRHALCACRGLDLSLWGLSTDAYDSSAGRYAASLAVARGSHVGVNGALKGTTPIVVGGSLIVADALGPNALPALDIRGDLRVGGPFGFTQVVEVAQNLWLASDLRGSAALHVAGNVVQAPAGTRETSVAPRIDGRDLRSPVAVGDPCRCAPDQQLDIAAFVAAAKAHNDNDAAGIRPDRLESLFVNERVELPDGKRIFLTRVGLEFGTAFDGAAGSLTLAAEGRSTLVIESFISIGDPSGGSALIFELGPDAELDLFVGGDVSVGVLTAPPLAGHRPARLRVYAGGTYFHGQVFGEANVYAPRADTFLLIGDLYGSLYANQIDVTAGELRVHYDSSVLAETRDCDWFDLTAAP